MYIDIEFIKVQLAKLQTWAEYDEFDFTSIRINPETEEVEVVISVHDNFQERYCYSSENIQIGTQSLPVIDGIVQTEDRLNREQRELHYMAARLGKTLNMALEFQSAAGRAFAQRLTTDAAELSRQLTAPGRNALAQQMRGYNKELPF